MHLFQNMLIESLKSETVRSAVKHELVAYLKRFEPAKYADIGTTWEGNSTNIGTTLEGNSSNIGTTLEGNSTNIYAIETMAPVAISKDK